MDLHYNAFISYRHHPQDIKVAETIHRSLERFKVPRALKKQGKKIERLFRDKEELPITSSLTDTITMALRNSDYQIVICSTHLKGSYWVQREIETFLQTHTKDQVLTVLVDGDNPYDVIPEILTYNEVVDPETGEVTREPIEPLSCDWRLPKRKAMREELPRLAAVLLGCSYDELRQRQRQYRMRRLITGLSVGVAASLALAGYFLHTSIQIQENLDQALRNQSQYLASASQEKFDSGDRLTAIALAMEALPNNEDRPYVAAAEHALTEALMLYEPVGEIISVASFNAESSIEDFEVTDDGKTIYILDNQYFVTVWDTVEQKKLSTFNIGGTRLMDDTMITDNDGNLLTLGGSDGKTLMCYSIDGTLLWQQDAIEDIVFCNGKRTLLAIRRLADEQSLLNDRFELLHLDPQTGKLTKEPFVAFSYSTISSPEFTSDTCYEDHPVSIKGFHNSMQHVLVIDPVSQKTQDVLQFDSLFYGGAVTEDNQLYVLTTENNDITNGRLGNYYFNSKAGAWLYRFDMATGRLQWRTFITSYNYSEANIVAPIPNSDRIFCQYGSAFLQLDAATGKILEECHSTNIPLTIQVRDTIAWVLFTNGCAGNYNFETNTLGYIQYMENGLLMGHNNNGTFVLPQLSSSVLLYRSTYDDSYEAFSGEYDDYIDDMCTHGNLLATYGYGWINLFDQSTRELLWKQELGYSYTLLGFSDDGSTLYLQYRTTICALDVASGDRTEWEFYSSDFYTGYGMYYDCIKSYDNTVCCMLYPYGVKECYIMFADCLTQETVILPFIVEEDISDWSSYGNTPIIMDLTDTHVLIFAGIGHLYRYDRVTNEITVITDDCPQDFVFLSDPDHDRMYFRVNNGILITDGAGNAVQTIPLTDLFPVSFYLYEDMLLFLGSDGMVHRYDGEGNSLGRTALNVFTNFFAQSNSISAQNVPVSWAVTPDNELVVNVFRMGNIINTQAWAHTASVQHLVVYNEGSDSFICQSEDMIYAYKRRSLGDILSLAKTVLKDFELTEETRTYYGLN